MLPTVTRLTKSPLWPNTQYTFAPNGGRPCDTAFPYFNLSMRGGTGMIPAVGWTGQWAATFAHRADRGLQITAPGKSSPGCTSERGEEIRTVDRADALGR